ncbi:MAG: hypothetical protein WBA45_08320 [Microthrixaceae bacterium]
MEDGNHYGRSEADWNELARDGLAYLKERARLGRTTSYTEMNAVLSRRTSQPPFDFSSDADRAAMGYLLGRIVEADRPESGLMISALVIYLEGNDAGTGFYRLAEQLEALRPKATATERESFWVDQLQRIYEAGRAPRRRSSS